MSAPMRVISARACAVVMPGLRRPITLRKKPPRLPRVRCDTARGFQSWVSLEGNAKSGGMTPTICMDLPLSSIVLPRNIAVGAEPALPQTGAKDNHTVLFRPVFVRGERTADRRRYAENREEVPIYIGPPYANRFLLPLQDAISRHEARHIRE